MLNAPTVGSAHKYIVVVTANDEVVTTLGSGFHMLGMQLATMCCGIARDVHLMITH